MTRIEIWSAFASNNSGSYTLVGEMASVDDARALADALRPVLDAHTAWHLAHPRGGDGPLVAFFREKGIQIVEHDVGALDDWPDRDTPQVVAVGAQVLLHVPFTVTMPRELGLVVYAEGGRVELELVHSHSPLLVVAELWMKDGWQQREERARRFQAMRRAIEHEHVLARASNDAWSPVVRDGDHEMLVVAVAPSDLVLAATLLEAQALRHELELRIRVVESPESNPRRDPLAHLRAPEPLSGAHQLVLWRAGPDDATSVRAVREVAGCELARAKELASSAPIEILDGVDLDAAIEGLATLRAAGCEAEVVQPKRRGR